MSHVTVIVGETPPVASRKARGGASIGMKHAPVRRSAPAAAPSEGATAVKKATARHPKKGAKPTTSKRATKGNKDA
jgi:hypothetical protein